MLTIVRISMYTEGDYYITETNVYQPETFLRVVDAFQFSEHLRGIYLVSPRGALLDRFVPKRRNWKW